MMIDALAIIHWQVNLLPRWILDSDQNPRDEE